MEVDFRAFSDIENRLVGVARKTGSKVDELERISRRVGRMHELNGERSAIAREISNINAERAKIMRLADSLSKVSRQYSVCEHKIEAYSSSLRVNNDSVFEKFVTSIIHFFIDKYKISLPGENKGGVFGKNGINGWNIGGIGVVKIAEDVVSFFNKRYKSDINKMKLGKLKRMDPDLARKVGWKRRFGFDDIFKGRASKAKAFDTRFYNNWKKLWQDDGLFADFKKGGKTAKFATAGLIFSGIFQGAKNYRECKNGDISITRAVFETISETAVDFISDWAIGAAVAAGVAAAFGSAPVLAVAAGTFIVKAGLDAGAKFVTGKWLGDEKDFVEATSDLILDAGHALIKGCKNLAAVFTPRPLLT